MGMRTVSPTWDNPTPRVLPRRSEECSAHSRRLPASTISSSSSPTPSPGSLPGPAGEALSSPPSSHSDAHAGKRKPSFGVRYCSHFLSKAPAASRRGAADAAELRPGPPSPGSVWGAGPLRLGRPDPRGPRGILRGPAPRPEAGGGGPGPVPPMSGSQPVSLFLSVARSRSVMTGEPATPCSPPTAGPASLDRPLKIGWLKKQRSIVKNWQQRYFVLKGQQLFYYKDEEEAKPQGSMCLLGSTIKEMASNPEEPGRFVFEVIPASSEQGWTGQDSFTLMAGSQAEMDEWVKSIRRVAAAPSGAVFGQRLADTVAYERKFGQHPVPILMEKCAAFIRDYGLDEEGVFRLPGQDTLVKQLRDAFDAGERPSFHRDTDVHTVASLFKLYLRELPEPVVPWSQYESFLLCGQLLDNDRPKGHEELLKQVSDLPRDNYNLLSYICRFLHEIQLNCHVNKMSVENLATVIGVNLIRPKIEDPATIMRGTPQIQRVMTALISDHEVLFPKSKDEPPSPPAQKNDPKKPPVPRSSVGWDAAEDPGPLPHARGFGPTASDAVASGPGGPLRGGVDPGENGQERDRPEAWKLQSRKRTQTLPNRKCFLSTAIQEGQGVKAEIFDNEFWSPSPDPKAGGGHKRTLSQDLGATSDSGTPGREGPRRRT
ncbi:rho GTPase-activating protein 25-like [Ornithorhynchus anatinus]|uniref:rho GTPase-activating protein 25-like n=1 Tax=Ornithorhynchus anatinus TaxID=9258 RepID=UPI0019D4CD72|nr:rho GTPase-activating protein 25-like [Ornithorhynchus anatinus]